MNVYQELTILPDPEISPYFIWSKLYTQLHIALADVKNKHGIDSIGVSFPGYRYEEKDGKTFATLGSKLRVFAPDAQTLETLNPNQWLERLSDYVHIKSIAPVPQNTGHVVVKRYHHINKNKQAKAFAEFKGIDFNEALAHCLAHKRGNVPYPFINMKSEDNQQMFKLCICQQEVQAPVDGRFNTYGINTGDSQVTVPAWRQNSTN